MGEIRPYLGHVTEMTLRVIKYVWNVCNIHNCDCTHTRSTLTQDRHFFRNQTTWKKKQNKNITPGFTSTRCSRPESAARIASKPLKWAESHLGWEANVLTFFNDRNLKIMQWNLLMDPASIQPLKRRQRKKTRSCIFVFHHLWWCWGSLVRITWYWCLCGRYYFTHRYWGF